MATMPSGRHEIPTHLNVEDRAVYGLSVRQLTYLVAGCSGAYGVWSDGVGLKALDGVGIGHRRTGLGTGVA